jgi:lysophospholipase L1-like esterase
MALAGFVMVGALPAAASPPIVQYAALGDSYAAGTAVGSFPNCPHSPFGYPALLDSESGIDLQVNGNATCSRATTSEVRDTQLSVLDRDTRLVTLTVGAADLHLSDVLAVCSDPTRTLECLATIQTVRNILLPRLGDDLTALYPEVADAAPRARIVVTGYPHLLEPAAPVDSRIIIGVNLATDELNAAIRQAVSVTQDADANIHYVDVVADFAGHGIGGTVLPPFIFAPPSTEAFHPTPAGYVAYADAISAALPRAWVDKQNQLV